MDEQNPRVGGERISGRGDELAAGRETSGTAGTSAGSTQRSRTVSSTGGRARPRSTTAEAPPEERTREIRAEIEHTRGELSETVNAIQERLSPGNIAANAAETVKTAARDKARDIAESESVQYVRANPIPTAMVTIGIAGLAWLAFGGREASRRGRSQIRRTSRDWRTGQFGRETYASSGGYSEYESARLRNTDLGYEDAGTDTGGLYSSGPAETEYTGGYSAAGYRGTSYGESDYGLDRTYRRAENGIASAQRHLRRAWDENPLVLGAASMVLGAVVGLAIPETERENDLMGESRDNLLETVQDTVKEKVTQVQEAATNAVGQVQEAAKSAVGLSDDSSTPKSNI